MTTAPPWPQDFFWGAATSAYQIEGGARDDGKGPSIWDIFAHQPGAIARGEVGDIACDHYHRWQADIDLMAQLGLRAYRFSIAWSRIMPQGRGALNRAGLDHYEKLVDALLERGIAPFVTLYHWDLPLALHEKGGWLRRDTAYYFADYAQAVAQRLGDRVRHWVTLNEPQVHAQLGYVDGTGAPGLRHAEHYGPAAHHQLLAHGLALEPLRGYAPAAQMGIAFNLSPVFPATDLPEDQEAAFFADQCINGAFLNGVLRGAYPDAFLALLPSDLIQSGDMEIISRPTELIGINYYLRLLARHPRQQAFFPYSLSMPETRQPTAMGWETYPEGLSYWLRRLQTDYPDHDLYITENGIALRDEPGPAGTVEDTRRIDYLREHIGRAGEAIREGARVKGYFVWSLLDNFEWAFGYRPRFGLAHVDFRTQERLIKASGYWYAGLIASGVLE